MTQNKMKVTDCFAVNEDLLRKCAAICNNGFEPTEKALMEYANVDVSNYKRTHEIPFDSATKFMQVTTECGTVWLKGAVEVVLERNGEDAVPYRNMLNKAEEMAGKGLRVLGFSVNGEFVGMLGLSDPLRNEIPGAVQSCKDAGIKVIMLTGDHKTTAEEIARQAGVDEVHARVSPEYKVEIVTRLKQQGHIVAMTGDGVNDAPALKKADIGIAMGITGTDVTKEAADMILTDDNFVSIVSAVELGRTIYDNIRKVTGYLLGCNIGEILIILIAVMLGLPAPLTATQLLFVNLLTDSFPAFILGMKSKSAGIMTRPPNDPAEPIINKTMRKLIAVRAVALTVFVLGTFIVSMQMFDYNTARNLCFAALVTGELLLCGVVYKGR